MESAYQLHQQYRAGGFSLSEKVESRLKVIEEHQQLNAFVEVFSDSARERAAQLDDRRRQGKPLGQLAGLILAIKDNLCIKDHAVTCGSAILDTYISPYNSTVVQRILDADGLIIGRTNMDEFAMGSSTETSVTGAARNPVDKNYVAGGSSGGSVVAVAAGLVDLALGSDTGGSIRQPAAFCGVVGMKPTYGLVSRYGLVAFASSLDQVGPIAKSVEDAALLLSVVAGADEHDSTSLNVATVDYEGVLQSKVEGFTLGVPMDQVEQLPDAEIREHVSDLLKRLEASGCKIVDTPLKMTKYGIAAYYIIATAEASSNLSRYDGVRYGRRSDSADSLDDMYIKTRSEGFGDEVKRRIMLGTYVLSVGYYDAYYRKAQQVRRRIKEELEGVLAGVDHILLPTTPTVAFKHSEKLDDPVAMYLSDVYTVGANLAGIPAISVPIGKTGDGLPIGVQLMGRALGEGEMLQAAQKIEELVQE